MAFTSVSGKVGRTFYNGLGAEIVESWQQGGETMTKRWSAVFEAPHGLTEGDQVSVSGIHGDKVDEWEKDGQTRHSVKRTLNKTKIKDAEGTSASQSAQQPESEPWATEPRTEPAVDAWANDPSNLTPF